MQLLTSKASELTALTDFYTICGYGGTFEAADDVYYALEKDRLIAVVRIAKEQGIYVLRGMQVDPSLRGQQLGGKLLRYMLTNISKECFPCYCLPHEHLTRFYGSAGFDVVEDSYKDNDNENSIPQFLLERQAHYTSKGLKIALMVHPVPS